MSEALRYWLRSRLGVIIDLSPEVFGHHGKDGTLLAKLLHSYDIINDDQLKTIIATQEPALARVNLRSLKVWLHFIGVGCDDDCIRKISEGKGITTLRLFHKVYLSLENKDRLHFITLQKEREKFIPTSTKFHVEVVQEEPFVKVEQKPDPFIEGLLMERYRLKKWYGIHFGSPPKRKVMSTYPDLDVQRDPSVTFTKKKILLMTVDSECDIHTITSASSAADIRPVDSLTESTTTTQESCIAKRKSLSEICEPDDESGIEVLLGDKKLKKDEEYQYEAKILENLQSYKSLATTISDMLLMEQELEMDRKISSRVTTQTECEKVITKKLFNIRKNGMQIVSNRQTVERMAHQINVNDLMMEQNSDVREVTNLTLKLEDECDRLSEMYKKKRDNEIMLQKMENTRISRNVIEDIVEIVIEIVGYRSGNDNSVPAMAWSAWLSLFRKGEVPIKRNEGNESSKAEDNKRQEIIQYGDVTDYLELRLPWSAFIPRVGSQVEYRLRQGFLLLGYIINRIVQASDQTNLICLSKENSSEVKRDYLPITVISISEEFGKCELDSILGEKNIDVIFLENAINFCLQTFLDEYKNRAIRKSEGGVRKSSTSILPFSDIALLGKLAHELLHFGKPLNCNLTAAIVAEYLKKISNNEKSGWLMVNYPTDSKELKSLELAMSEGRAYLDRATKYHITHRSQLQEEKSETFSIYKTPVEKIPNSRMLPNPKDIAIASGLTDIESWTPPKFVAAFVKLIPTVQGMYETPKLDDKIPMDKLYKDLNIARVLSYDDSDFGVLANELARIVTLEAPRMERLSIDPKHTTSSQSIKESATNSIEGFNEQQYEPRLDFRSFENVSLVENWSCFEIPLPRADILRSFWTHIERIYLNSLTDILHIKRIHFSHIIPRRISTLDLMKAFIRRPDAKQKLLRKFQTSFDAFNPDFRENLEVKYEFFCRINDFKKELESICDQRKTEAKLEQRRIVMDHWTTLEMVALINVYLTIFQIEADRCIDILQLICDYYIIASPTPTFSKRFKKARIPKLEKVLSGSMENIRNLSRDASDISSTSFLRPIKSGKLKVSIGERKMQSSSKMSILDYALNDFDYDILYAEITKLIADTTLVNFDVTKLSWYQLIKKTIQAIESHVNSVSTMIGQFGNKETTGTRDKKNSQRMNAEIEQEWNFAVKSEINRIKYRLNILEASMCSDIQFLLTSAQRTVDMISSMINIRYEKEMQSINEMASVFRLAIENAVPINNELKLNGDQFYVQCQKVVTVDVCKSEGSSIRQLDQPSVDSTLSSPLQLYPMQLTNIIDTFQQISPHGELPEREFSFVIQDLISYGDDLISEETDDPLITLVPPLWKNLNFDRLSTLNFRIFGDVDYVNWRDFVVSALDTDILSMPTQHEILTSRAKFRSLDSGSLELVELKKFYKAIDNCTFVNISPQQLRQFYTNVSALNVKENRRTFESDVDIINSHVENVLFKMFNMNGDLLNYTLFLLTLCKDEDPRIGFGKALALMMGNEICVIGQPECAQYERLLRKARQKEIKVDDDDEDDTESSIRVPSITQKTPMKEESVSLQKRKIHIENLDLLDGKSVAIRDILKADMDIPFNRSFTRDSDVTFSIKSESLGDGQNLSNITNLDEADINKKLNDSSMIHWIPLDVCQMTLMAVLSPTHTIRPGQSRSISNTLVARLKKVYEDLKHPTLQDRENMVLSHELLNHAFINKLLSHTNKFTVINLTPILEEILNEELYTSSI